MRIYKILDYENSKIVQDFNTPEDVAKALDVVSQYSNSFEVITTNGEFVMSSFIQTEGKGWEYLPLVAPRN